MFCTTQLVFHMNDLWNGGRFEDIGLYNLIKRRIPLPQRNGDRAVGSRNIPPPIIFDIQGRYFVFYGMESCFPGSVPFYHSMSEIILNADMFGIDVIQQV